MFDVDELMIQIQQEKQLFKKQKKQKNINQKRN